MTGGVQAEAVCQGFTIGWRGGLNLNLHVPVYTGPEAHFSNCPKLLLNVLMRHRFSEKRLI